MNAIVNATKDNDMKGANTMMKERREPRHHIPPHERKSMISIEFDEKDWKHMIEVFGDEDTASAAVVIIKDAPPEIQVLAVQLMNMIEEVA